MILTIGRRISFILCFFAVAVLACQILLGCIAPDGGRLTFTSPLPPRATPADVATPNATRTVGASLVPTKEAGLTLSRWRAEAAGLLTPDPTPLFLKLHPAAVVWPTPDMAIPRAALGGTPAGAGTILTVVPPFYTHEYGYENSWFELTDGDRDITYVHAGFVPTATGAATLQGLVVVQTLRKNPTNTNYDMVELSQYSTPAKAGPVHVVDAVGSLLILQSALVSTFYFDVSARQFVPSLPETVTATSPTGSSATPALPVP